MSSRTAPPPPEDDFVREFRHVLEAAYEAIPLGERTPQVLGDCFERAIRAHAGRQQVYIGAGVHYRVEEIRADIAAHWNGANTMALAKKWDISDKRVYQIALEVRARKQPDLFGGGEKAA